MNELSIIPYLIDCTRLESFLCGASAAWPDFIDSDHSIEFSSTTFLSALRITPPFQLQLVGRLEDLYPAQNEFKRRWNRPGYSGHTCERE